MAPAKTPPEAVNALNRAINEALRKPDLVEKLRGIGAQPMPGSPQDFKKFIESERGKWNPLVKRLGIKAG
jgi:tripartite-type tricarboxylate transporter receptor subunit TctC